MSAEHNLSGKIDAVVNLAGHWKNTMPKKPGRRDENGQQRDWVGLTELLEEFSVFAKGYKAVLGKVPLANQGFIMNHGTERLLQNFEILSRASEQRKGVVTRNSPVYFLALAEDRLSDFCTQWQPNSATQATYLTLKTPVVYFEKAYGISRALYRPDIPLISIPLTEYNTPERWLALAHEMGHHVYWNSLGSLEKVEKLHQDMYAAMLGSFEQHKGHIVEPWGSWMEEIFADICGVLFAGPEYLLSTQDLAAEQIRQKEDFAKNDGEHPSPYLRPWIAYEVLRSVTEPNTNDEAFLKKAEERWMTFCEDAGELVCNCGDQRMESLTALRREVGQVVNVILNRPVWPNGKRLLDLINYIRRDMDPNTVTLLPPFSDPGGPIRDLLDEDIPENIIEIWNFLKDRLPDQTLMSPREKVKNRWNAFINLSLEDSHGHRSIGPHQNIQFHWWAFWAGFHKHDQGIIG